MASANSTAQLRGVVGEPTEGLTVNGSHNISLDMHEFEVSISGNYTLYEDVDGGSTYVRRTDWSETTGKYVRGSDLDEDAQKIHSIKFASGFSTLKAAFKNTDDEFESVFLMGEKSKTETFEWANPGTTWLEGSYIVVQSKTRILIPPGHKINRLKTTGNTNGTAIFQIDGVEDVHIDGGEYDGNAVVNDICNEHDHCFNITGSKRIRIENCHIHDFAGDAICISEDCEDIWINNCVIDIPNLNPSSLLVGRNGISIAPTGGYIRRVYITNCTITGGIPGGIDIEPNPGSNCLVSDIFIANNKIKAITQFGISLIAPKTGSETMELRDIHIESNIIEDCYESGIAFSADSGAYINGVHISHNTIKGCGNSSSTNKSGIVLRSGAQKIIIDGNTIKECGFGILVLPPLYDVMITNNIIIENNYTGIFFSSGGSATKFINMLVSNNLIKNNSQFDAGYSDGLTGQYMEDSMILNNDFVDDQGTPTQQYGFYLTNSTKITIGQNRINGYESGPFILGGGCANIDFAGLTALPERWYENIAASLGSTAMRIPGTAIGQAFVVPKDGFVVALSVSSSAAVTAGTITVKAEIGSTPLVTDAVTLTTTNPTINHAIICNSPKKVTAGDRIVVAITSDASLTPSGSLDITATVWMI
jgi:hypothetical protein